MTRETDVKWYRQARHDFEIAAKNIPIGGFDVAAFLAQQSVEKALKACFALEDKKIPRTHYLDELAALLELPQEVFDEAAELAADYTFARYPDVAERTPFEEYTRELAEARVEAAGRIFKQLLQRFPRLEELQNG